MDLVPDTSVVVDGRVSDRHRRGDALETVYVPEAVVSELEAQANDGRESGWDGLAELRTLADLVAAGELTVEYVGRTPSSDEIGGAATGDVDALIRQTAAETGAVLLTSDAVQAEVARAKEIEVEYVEPAVEETPVSETLAIESYLDETTMSLHLKTGVAPMAKRGTIGEMHYEPIEDSPSTEAEMQEFVSDIERATRDSSAGFVELDQPGMRIIQFRDMRIALARPPFADGIEITAVRPIVKTELEDYKLADSLRDRLSEHQRGALIAGAPGAGKSTFAQAVAEFLADADYAVKTMEKPRDLQVGPGITQYTELGGSMENTADSLLMVRPDYTIYDEVRKTSDFRTFADMRLAGVGMIGVVHATRAIDALQRLVGRVELGMIPQVVDTVVYIEAGEVHTVYDVTTEVKVPHGLMQEDLARPVVVISEFESGEPAYEIYTFNRQVVTVPLDEEGAQGAPESGVDRLARNEIEREVKTVARGAVDVELQSENTAIVYVDENDISYVIGKGGGRITDIENRLGINIDVRTFDERQSAGGAGGAVPTNATDGGDAAMAGQIVAPEISSNHVIIPFEGHAGESVEVRAAGEYLFTATVSNGGEIQVSRGSAIAEELEDAIDRGRQIQIAPQ